MNERDGFEIACIAAGWITVALGVVAIATGDARWFTYPLMAACLLLGLATLVGATLGVLRGK